MAKRGVLIAIWARVGGETLQRRFYEYRPLIYRTVHAMCKAIFSKASGVEVRH